jgi:hypothetical protein
VPDVDALLGELGVVLQHAPAKGGEARREVGVVVYPLGGGVFVLSLVDLPAHGQLQECHGGALVIVYGVIDVAPLVLMDIDSDH